jgi:hypothetical protein
VSTPKHDAGQMERSGQNLDQLFKEHAAAAIRAARELQAEGLRGMVSPRRRGRPYGLWSSYSGRLCCFRG